MRKTMTLRRSALTLGWAVLLATGSSLAGAQADTSAAPAPSAKKELVAKIIKLQQPVIEGVAQNLVEQPAAQLMQQAGMALQARVPADKREEVGKGIQADVKKYLDEAAPLVKERAVKLAPATVGVILEEKFSEEELRQLIAILESPVNRRLQELGGEMQRSLSDKLIAEARPEVEPKVRALQQNMAKRLGADVPSNPPPATGAKPPAKPASK
jgi:hypothetical protein